MPSRRPSSPTRANGPRHEFQVPPRLRHPDPLELRALDELLQAGLAGPRHPILRDWTDVLHPLRRKVADLLNRSSTTKAIPR